MATQTDPVCGMQVDPQKAAGRSDYQGKTYYFCCSACKPMFDKNPEKYLKAASAQTRPDADKKM